MTAKCFKPSFSFKVFYEYGALYNGPFVSHLLSAKYTNFRGEFSPQLCVFCRNASPFHCNHTGNHCSGDLCCFKTVTLQSCNELVGA